MLSIANIAEDLKQFYVGSNHFDRRHAFDQIQRLFKHLIHVATLIRDTGHSKDGLLPEVLTVHFGDGEVKLAPKPVLEPMNDLPLVLKRLAP